MKPSNVEYLSHIALRVPEKCGDETPLKGDCKLSHKNVKSKTMHDQISPENVYLLYLQYIPVVLQYHPVPHLGMRKFASLFRL